MTTNEQPSAVGNSMFPRTADDVHPLREKFTQLAGGTFDRLGAAAPIWLLYLCAAVLAIIGGGSFFGFFENSVQDEVITTQIPASPNSGLEQLFPGLREEMAGQEVPIGVEQVFDPSQLSPAWGIIGVLVLIAFLLLYAVYAIVVSRISDAFLVGEKPSVKEAFTLKGRFANAFIAVLLNCLYWILFGIVASLLLTIAFWLTTVSAPFGAIVVAIIGLAIVIGAVVSLYGFALQPVFGALGFEGFDSFKASWKVTIKSFDSFGILYMLVLIASAIPVLNLLVPWYRDTLVANATAQARFPEGPTPEILDNIQKFRSQFD